MKTTFYLVLMLSVLKPTLSHARDSKIDKARYKDAFWDVLASLELLRVECASSAVAYCGPRSGIYIKRIKTSYQTIDHRFPAHQELSDAILAIERGLENNSRSNEIADLTTSFERKLVGQLDAVPLPAESLNFALGQSRYIEHCAACHGNTGNADGTLTPKLNTPLRSFVAPFRSATMTPLSNYAVMISGSAGTEMTSFVEALSQDEMWSVAFYVSSLPHSAPQIALSDDCKSTLFKTVDLNQLMTLTDVELKPLSHKISSCEVSIGSLRTIGTFDHRLARELNGELAARGSKSARGLVVLSLAIAFVSGGFVWILTRRARVK